MATSSFFYGGSSAPDQNTVNELIGDLESSVQEANAARDAAQTSATAASISSGQAASSATSAAASAAEAASIISHFTISTSDPSGGVEGDVWFKVT